jgi:SulP family sulfate permease
MAPRVIFLSRYTDGTLRNAKLFNLQQCENISILRFEGSLYFANTSYFENMVQKALSKFPKLKFLIVDGVSMNQIDATGEEMLRELVERLGEEKIEVLFFRFKKPIIDMLKKTGFIAEGKENNFFRKSDDALEYAWGKLAKNHKDKCPLHKAIPIEKKANYSH